MNTFVGTGKSDVLKGGDEDEIFFGEGGADVIEAGDGDDIVHGGGGNDMLNGNDGNDVVFGSVSKSGAVDFDKFRIAESVTGSVTFLGETAGYKNALGMYKIADDGSIYDVEILFANASLQGSGGNLVSGKSSVNVDLESGDKVGFFIVPNAYSKSQSRVLLDGQNAQFKFVDAKGNPANVNGGEEVKLVHVSSEGKETVVNSQYGDTVFHSHGGADGGLNGDNFNHVKGEVSVEDGKVRIGFEDLKGGGDQDFDDSIFALDIGQTNAALLPKEQTKVTTSTDDDKISGGDGNDKLFGMRGNDEVFGGAGDDVLYGNSGNDGLDGGSGNDVLKGGSGNDVLVGGLGDDVVHGNSGDDLFAGVGGEGNDTFFGESGNDTAYDGAGDDSYAGGSGDDVFYGAWALDNASSGNDVYLGGSGFDTLSFAGSDGNAGINVDLSKHVVTGFGKDEVWSIERIIGSDASDVFKGDKRDNVIDGADGDDEFRGLGGADTFTGGGGADTYVWYGKDVVDAKSGDHLGVDRITDFNASEGDVINLYRITKELSFSSVDEVVDVRDVDGSAVVSVKIDGQFVDVVEVNNVTADDLLSDGAILT